MVGRLKYVELQMVSMWFPEQRQVWGWWRSAKQGGAGAGLHVMAGHTGRTQDNGISLTSVSFDTWDAQISVSVCTSVWPFLWLPASYVCFCVVCESQFLSNCAVIFKPNKQFGLFALIFDIFL